MDDGLWQLRKDAREKLFDFLKYLQTVDGTARRHAFFNDFVLELMYGKESGYKMTSTEHESFTKFYEMMIEIPFVKSVLGEFTDACLKIPDKWK